MADNTVLVSIEAPGGAVCVDLFRRPDGSFGFEHYRRDAEDGRGWFPVGFHAERKFDDAGAALDAALLSVPWLADHLGDGVRADLTDQPRLSD